MDRFDRIYSLHKILAARRTPISRNALEEKLESNRSTVKRTIGEMRLYLGAPICYDRKRNGYYYDTQADGHAFEIPGLWFNSNELFALLVTQRLLTEIQPGFLNSSIAPFRKRIQAMLQGKEAGQGEIARRVRILQTAARSTNLDDFRMLTTALVQRRRINVLYHGRAADQTTERLISPQRIVYYRDNWYLDAWCHLRQEMRTFSLDRLKPVYIDDRPAREIKDAVLDAHVTATFGIFAGKAEATAILLFSAEAARWVADEHWHPDQQGRVRKDGCYELKIPYGDPAELIREILKYGAAVEVIAPASLRKTVAAALQDAAALYHK